MIGSGELRHGDREEEMVRLAQQGRIETIMRHKKPIHLKKLFRTNQPLVVLPPPPHTRLILIEGAPGGGKSTLALHICYQWAQGASFLTQFDLVVLAYLHDQAIQKATTLADILPARTLEMLQMVASQMQSSDGANVLFVFDGWDEFPSHLQNNSLVSTIIQKPWELFLLQSTVLITSRPVSSGNLLHIADRRVEILGFTKRQIREYIEKALDGNSTRIQKLVQHLEEHPVIEGYCYVPLHVAILVHIFLTMKGALPTTLHEHFCNLVLCCIVRELDTHESESDTSQISSLDDLPDDLKSKLSDLCVLAYEGVMQNKVVFYYKDLRKFNLPANLPSLGLLQAVEGLTFYSKSLSYNFLHLSVQELLAAYHIKSHINFSEQRRVFEHMFESSHFQAVLQYYSAFTKLTNPVIRNFISTYSQQKSSIKDLLPLLHCFYEAQEPSLCKLVFTRECIELNSVLNPVDYLAIGYFVTSLLSVPSSDTLNVILKIRKIGDEHMLRLLLLELSKYPIGEANVRRLEITMQLHDINSYFHHIFEGLQHNFALVHLNISDTGLVATKDTAQALTKMLQVNKTLTHLDLSKNHDLSGACVYQGLQDNTSLVYLNLSNTRNLVTEDTALALSKMLKDNKTLTHLLLSNKLRLFSYSGAYCVFQGLQHNTSLVHLNISKTGLVATEDTAQALTTMLQVNKTLTHLDLSLNWSFSDAGAYCVSQGLQYNTSLVYLNLRHTGMTDKGAEYIAQALESNCSLQKLDMGSNQISERGFACIDKSKTNTTLSLNKSRQLERIVAHHQH